jgi:hypothetical protein
MFGLIGPSQLILAPYLQGVRTYIINVLVDGRVLPADTHFSLSGLGSDGLSSKMWVGRAKKERWVKTWRRMVWEFIGGSVGQPNGPYSGLDAC